MQTFRLAEGLTHWFAAEHLKANLVSPLEQAPVNIVRAAAGAPFPKQMPAYFRQAQKVKLKAEPDFLAIEGSVYHVLESKGRSDFLNNMIAQTKLNSARNEGLRQICRIRTINGATPETRSACVFAFDNVGTRGQVTDPPETDTYDLQVPFEALVKQAYRTVLDPLFLENRRKLDFGLEGVEFAPGRTFAINSKVLKLVLAVEGEGSARRVVEFLSIRGSEFIAERYENVSMGRDGMALIAPEPNDEFTLGRR